jgi:hypothetical protein
MDTISFKDSIENYLPIYFYFLDGFLNPDHGYNKNKILNFLYNNNNFLIPIEISDICYLNFNYNNNNIELNFYNCRNEIPKKIIITNGQIDDNICDIIEQFKYCICQISANNHATSILIFIEDDKINVLSFNSGKGIKRHYNYNELFQPYFGIVLDNNIPSIKIILSLFLLNELYNLSKEPNTPNIPSYPRNYLLNPDILSIIKLIKSFNKSINFNDIGFDVKLIIYEQEYTYDNIDFISTPFYLKNQYLILENKFYDILINYLNNFKKKFNFKYEKLDNIIFESFNNHIKNKLILHYVNENLLINDQESGSCTWFSIYWPLIFYNIFKNNYEGYYYHVIHIYNGLKQILDRVFTNDIFIYDETYNTDIVMINNLYNKLVNINLLDPNIVNNNYNNIYNINGNYNFNQHIKNNIQIKYLEKINETLRIDGYNEELDIYWISKLYNTCVSNTNSFYLFIYELYKHNKQNELLLFVNEYIDFNILMKEIIEYYGTNGIKTVENIDEETGEMFTYETEIIDDDLNTFILDIRNYIDQFNNINNNSVEEPIYIYRYIYIVLYFNENNFEDENLLSIINFFHKFNLFITIYNYIIDFCNKYENDMKQSFINIIMPTLLINKSYTDEDNIDKFEFEFINLNYLEKFIKFSYDNEIKINNKYVRTIKDYQNIIDFLCLNPTRNLLTIDYLFIKLNKYYILKNEKYQTNLIEYCASEYFFFKTKYSGLYDNEIISNLQILLCGSNGIPDIIRDEDDKKNYNYFIYEYNNISLGMFKSKIDEIFKKFENNKSLFCKYLSNPNNRSELTFDRLNFLIDKFNIILDDYNLLNNFHFNNINLHNILNNNIYNNIFLKNNNELMILNDFYYIKIIYDDSPNDVEESHIDEYSSYYDESESKTEYSSDRKILSIYFNNYLIEKFEDIIYPFKYIIPKDCHHFIYKIADIYHITYFIEKSNISDPLLGNCNLETGIYTISINKNNQMYPNNKYFKLYVDICKNFGVNHFNIIYLKPYNLEKEKTSLFLNEKYYNILIDNEFYKKKLKNITYKNINLLYQDKNNIIELNKSTKYKDENESIKKLLFKISSCELTIKNKSKIEIILKRKIIKFKNLIKIYTEFMKDKSIYQLFDKYYENIYLYLIHLKILNTYKILLQILTDKPENFCSQVKIYYEQYKIKKKKFTYNFEALFELVMGSELYNEQIERYTEIIKSYDRDFIILPKNINGNYNIVPYNQFGGYPLHHFMMGKGKSAVLTPILTLYFSLILNKKIYIIVPEHLVPQTEKTISCYAHVFNLKLLVIKDEKKYEKKYEKDIDDNNIIICSDAKIKELFLLGLFIDIEKNNNSIMLIDEFDSILDPIKSNFNIIKESNVKIEIIYNKLKPIKNINQNIISIKNGLINEKNDLLSNDIKNILKQINNNNLVENINWGIHPLGLYAIPYRSKDNPLLNSYFSSGVITAFLTLYYFIVINKYNINYVIINYIIEHNIISEYFKMYDPVIISKEFIEELLLNESKRLLFFNYLFDKIFLNLKLTSKQYNTSFVDILNIDGLFKI